MLLICDGDSQIFDSIRVQCQRLFAKNGAFGGTRKRLCRIGEHNHFLEDLREGGRAQVGFGDSGPVNIGQA